MNSLLPLFTTPQFPAVETSASDSSALCGQELSAEFGDQPNFLAIVMALAPALGQSLPVSDQLVGSPSETFPAENSAPASDIPTTTTGVGLQPENKSSLAAWALQSDLLNGTIPGEVEPAQMDGPADLDGAVGSAASAQEYASDHFSPQIADLIPNSAGGDAGAQAPVEPRPLLDSTSETPKEYENAFSTAPAAAPPTDTQGTPFGMAKAHKTVARPDPPPVQLSEAVGHARQVFSIQSGGFPGTLDSPEALVQNRNPLAPPPQDDSDTRNSADQLPPVLEKGRHAPESNLVSPAPRTVERPAIPVIDQVQATIRGHLEVVHQQGRVSLEMSLRPPELGRINLHLSLEDNQVHVHMLVHDDAARSILEQQLEPLRVRCLEMGVQLGQLDVRRDGGNAQEQPQFEADTPGAVRPGRSRAGASRGAGYPVAPSANRLVDLFA